MGLSESYTRKVLHMAYILSLEFDSANHDLGSLDTEKKDWEEKRTAVHRDLYTEIESDTLKICDRIAGNIYRYIRRNGLSDNKVLNLCNEIDNSKDLELVTKNKSKFVELLQSIQRIQEDIDFNTLAIDQLDLPSSEDIIFPNTLECAKLLIILNEINEILSENKKTSQLTGELWTPGGIQNFIDKRKELTNTLLGQRQEYVRDSVVWKKALYRVQTTRLLSIRGLGGYGKTTLARELIYDLLVRHIEEVFSEYFLISFKTKEQGDLDVKSGGTVSPDTGMKYAKSNFDDVIDELYSGLTGNYNPEEVSQVTLSEKRERIISTFCERSCLIVLDNYEDIEAGNNIENKKQFDEFFKEIGERSKNIALSCVLITSRAPKTKDDDVASRLFVTIDLEHDDPINTKTSRGIILGYLNKQIKDDSEKRSQVETARRNLDNPDGGWTAVTNEIATTKGFDQGYIQQLIKYPIICIYIAAQMIKTGKAPLPVIKDFLSQMNSDEPSSGGLEGNRLVEYVVSKSYENLLSDGQKDDLAILVNDLQTSDKISYPDFLTLYERRLSERLGDIGVLWRRLIELKFLIPLRSDDTIYQIPPIQLAFLRNHFKTQKPKANILQEAYKILSDKNKDSLSEILQNMNIIVSRGGLPNAPISAIANCLINTMKHSDKLQIEDKRNWLNVNEYVERNYASSISNKNTRTFAGRILSEFKEELDDFPGTLSSIVRQLNFEITRDTNQSIFKLISEYFSNIPSIEYNPDKTYSVEQTIHFDSETEPEIIIQTKRRSVFNIDDTEGNSRYFVYYGNSYDLEEIINSTVLITRIGQSNVYDIEVIKPPNEQPNIEHKVEENNQEEIKTYNQNDLVVEILLKQEIFKSKWQLGHLSLGRLNRYLGANKIDAIQLKKILEGHSYFEVDSNSIGGDNEAIFLVRSVKTEAGYIALCEDFGIPSDLLVYPLLFEMIYQKAKNNRNRFLVDKEFETSLKKGAKGLALSIEWDEIKQVINLIQRSSDKKIGNIRFSTSNKNKFLEECIMRLTENINRKISLRKQKLSTFDSTKHLVKLNKLCTEMMQEIRDEMKSFTSSIEDKGQVFSEKIQRRVTFAPRGSHENFISRLVENIVKAAEEDLPLKELRTMLAYEFNFSKSKVKKQFPIKLDKSGKISIDDTKDQLVVELQKQMFWNAILPMHKAMMEEDAENLLNDAFAKFSTNR